MILLVAINAKYIHSNLAVHSLKASAGKFTGEVELAEFTINQQKDYILESVFRSKPSVLCFSCYIWNISYVESIAKEFHKLAPDVPIWLGGPEVSFEVKDFLKKHSYVKGIMIGEGEETFRELCGYYLEGGELGKVSGLAYREEGEKLRFTPPREEMNLSSLPFCYDHLEEYSNRIIYYESSRGCPFSCSYCLSSVDKKLRFRNLELVKEELSFFLDRKVPQVKFVDRTFNCDHRHAQAIWRFIKEHDNGVTNFHFEISADLLKDEEVELLGSLRPGLVQLEIGVQSTKLETIREIHRSMNLERLKEVVTKIHSVGNINQHLDLIAGLPLEGYESFRRSFDEIYALWSEQLQLGFLKVLKGSYLYEHADEYGILCHDEPPYEVLSTKWLSYEELLRIKKVEEQLEIYYNSGQYEVTMKVLYPVTGSAFDFYLKLGEFYAKNGYLGMQHSRIRRCEILLEFLATEEFWGGRRKELGATQEEVRSMVRESLIFDLYERENCKTRPAWAPDPKGFREETHKLCTKGKLSHLEPFHYLFPDKRDIGLSELPQRREKPVWILFDYESHTHTRILSLQ